MTPLKKPRLIDDATTTDAANANGQPPESQPMTPQNARYDNSSTSSAESIQEKSSNSKVKLSPSFKKIISTSPIVKLKKITNSDEQPSRRYPKRLRRPPPNILAIEDASSRASSATSSSKDKAEKKDKKKPVQLEDLYDWSDCKVAYEHDKKYNFFPEEGPSHINYYENVPLPGYYAPISMNNTSKAVDEENEYDLHIQSMYDASMFHHSPMSQTAHSPDPLFNISDPDDDYASHSPFQVSTPLLRSIKANFQSSSDRLRSRHGSIAIAPVTITPTAATVLADLINFDLPQVVSKTPFYSNCDDVANIKEVGNHILHIPNLTECDTFQSSLITTGLDAWRRTMYMNIMSMDDKDELLNKNQQEIREFFAVQKRIVIVSSQSPPSVNQAELWLQKKRNCSDGDKETMDLENDSPIKIRREKAKVIVENGDGAHDDDEDIECDVSLSCSPIAVLTTSQNAKPVNKHLLKVATGSVKAKKSLNNAFDELKKSNIVRESPNLFSDCGDSESPTIDVHDTDEEIPSSQVITVNHRRSKNNNHMNGHADSASKRLSDSSPLVNSVS